jgi:hypothetical protein
VTPVGRVLHGWKSNGLVLCVRLELAPTFLWSNIKARGTQCCGMANTCNLSAKEVSLKARERREAENDGI